ncbi:Holliday junction resolvase [Candidatus Woesearchaeota archaeon]|nr:Holliday junction resolvase [Candidatus Woesearchaeota archaeon]
MSLKSKGIAGERELVHLFNNHGWVCIRTAGSGSMKYPAPDLLAGNNLRKTAIECKTSRSDAVYIEKQAIADLKYFATTFGAEAWIAVRFLGKPWHFLSLEDLHETEKNLAVSITLAQQKGLLFEEFVR